LYKQFSSLVNRECFSTQPNLLIYLTDAHTALRERRTDLQTQIQYFIWQLASVLGDIFSRDASQRSFASFFRVVVIRFQA